MLLSFSISHLLDNILADSAISCRAEQNTMLTRDNLSALTRLARLAFADTVLKLNTTRLVNDFDDGSANDSDIMTIDVTPADSSVSQQALHSQLSLALTWRIKSMTDSNRAKAYDLLASDAVSRLTQALIGSIPSRTRSHWY